MTGSEHDRRAFLVSAGKFAAVVPPAMTLLLSTSMNSPAIAQSAAPGGGGSGGNGNSGSSGVGSKGNNGVGNGVDAQPPGNPPINDGPGTAPGMPAARTRNR
jgi:hypothetical protein